MAERESPASGADGARRASKRGAQPIQSLIEASLEPALRSKGFASAAIHLHWGEIVGAQLAAWSEPVALRWPPRAPGADPDRAREGATLTIKVEGAFALDLQHQAPQVIQRVNSFFGWRCVGKLLLKQGPVRKPGEAPRRRKPELSAEASQRLDAALATVDDFALKAALTRLGVGVLGRR